MLQSGGKLIFTMPKMKNQKEKRERKIKLLMSVPAVARDTGKEVLITIFFNKKYKAELLK